MKSKNTKNNDLINKGVMLGVHFSTVLFNDYFKDDFQRKLNVEAPLKGVLLMVIADVLVRGDRERMLELFDWATGTHLSLLDKVDSKLIEDCLREIELKKINLN